MEVRTLEAAQDLASYDAWVRTNPNGNLWQSREWKKYQDSLGRETRIYALMEGTQILASALVVIDRTAFGFSTWDIPRGPIWDLGLRTEDVGPLISIIMNDAKKNGALSLYFSPPIPFPSPKSPARSEQRSGGQVPSPSLRHEQPSATRVIDLEASEENILKQMKPKGRYNISVAEKHDIRVQQSEDIPAFSRLLKKTGQRDNFTIHPARHYEAFLKELPKSFLLLACARQTPIAGLLGVIWGSKAYYYYGASAYEHRALMAPYALQWTAMRHCKAAGCTSYDLLGIIAPLDAPPDHPWQGHGGRDRQWQGVSGFKEKFGGTVVIYPPEQEIVLRPMTSRLLRLKRRLLG